MNTNITNNKEGRPLEHYAAVYRELDPADIERRCGFVYDNGAFAVTFCGAALRVTFPEFATEPEIGNTAKILLLRHMCEGRFTQHCGKFLAYRDVPWGSLYDANFQGRCIKRFAYSFGGKVVQWHGAMLKLGARPFGGSGDAAFDWDVLPGLTVRYILWEGEPEDGIAPAAQILFGDNLPEAFSAEDLCVVGDVMIGMMKSQKI